MGKIKKKVFLVFSWVYTSTTSHGNLSQPPRGRSVLAISGYTVRFLRSPRVQLTLIPATSTILPLVVKFDTKGHVGSIMAVGVTANMDCILIWIAFF